MHDCPNCGQACYCSGDIDDIPVYTEAWVIQNCRHDCDEDDIEDDGDIQYVQVETGKWVRWNEAPSFVEVECKLCMGSGYIDDGLCPECDGSQTSFMPA